MVAFKRILVTTDLSGPSCAAFPLARGLAEKFGAKLFLGAVVEDPAELALFTVMDNPGFFASDLQEEVIQRVGATVDSYKSTFFEGFEVEGIVEESRGPVHQAILRIASQKQCDVIVMATRGRTGFMRFVLGSVSDKVVRESLVPVLLVPARDEAAT